MTAIAAFSVDTCPVVFGDLLITGETKTTRAVAVPALGDVGDFFQGSGWSILGLQQKVVLINERCMLAWSGSWIGARVAIAELRAISNSTKLTTDGVRAFLAGHSDVARHGTSFVGWVHEEEGNRFGQFRHQAEVIDAGALGRMSVQGSGTDAIKELVDLWRGMQGKSTGEVNAAVRAVATGFSMSSMLLRAEFHGGNAAPTLRSMFGGGYEVAAFFNGSFRKAGNLTFVIWNARVTSAGVQLTLPQLILKQTYVGDTLLLLSARISNDYGKPPTLIDEQRHVVLPMYSIETKVPKEELSKVSFDSPLLCHCFMVQGEEDHDLMVYTRVQQTGPTSASAMKIQDAGGQITLSLNDAFIREVAQSLQHGMSYRP